MSKFFQSNAQTHTSFDVRVGALLEQIKFRHQQWMALFSTLFTDVLPKAMILYWIRMIYAFVIKNGEFRALCFIKDCTQIFQKKS